MLADNSLDWSIGEALAYGTLLKEGELWRRRGDVR